MILGRPIHASDLNRWQRCGMQFNLSEIAGFKASFRNAAAIHGTAIHDVIRRLHESGQPLKPVAAAVLKAMYRDAFEEELMYGRNPDEAALPVKWPSKASPDVYADEAMEMLLGYCEDERNNKANVIMVESEWTADAGNDIVLAGRLDRIDDLGDGTCRIVDFKTGQTAPGDAFMSVWPQAHIYALAGENATFRFRDPVTGKDRESTPHLRVAEVCWLHMRHYIPYKRSGTAPSTGRKYVAGERRGPAWHVAKIGPGSRAEMMRELGHFRDAIVANRFERRPSTDVCSSCSVSAACAALFMEVKPPIPAGIEPTEDDF